MRTKYVVIGKTCHFSAIHFARHFYNVHLTFIICSIKIIIIQSIMEHCQIMGNLYIATFAYCLNRQKNNLCVIPVSIIMKYNIILYFRHNIAGEAVIICVCIIKNNCFMVAVPYISLSNNTLSSP